MRIIVCHLHARQQTIAMLDLNTGEVVEKTLEHEAEKVREFYSALPSPVVVGIEATGSMYWFLKLRLSSLGHGGVMQRTSAFIGYARDKWRRGWDSLSLSM